MVKQYRIIFQGLAGDEENFRTRIVKLGASPASVDTMLQKAPIVLKQGMTFEFSKRYADAVRKAGGIVEVLEYGCVEAPVSPPISIASFKDFIMCPECGLKQQKSQSCVKCGFRMVGEGQGLEPKNVTGH